MTTLALVARIVADRFGRSEAELRLGGSAQTFEVQTWVARKAFAWVADQVCEADRATIALWLGHGFDTIAGLIAEAEADRANPAYAELLDEIALECVAEAAVRDKLGLLRPGRDPRDIAFALIHRRGITSDADLRSLAAAFLAYDGQTSRATRPVEPVGTAEPGSPTPSVAHPLLVAARAVGEAYRRYQSAMWSPGERAARATLDKTTHALSEHPALGLPAKPRKPQTQPEKAHG